MAYVDFKDLRTASDKILRDAAFNIAKNPKHDRYQRRLASMVYKFFDKKTSATRAGSETLVTQNKFAGSDTKNENVSHKELQRRFSKTDF